MNYYKIQQNPEAEYPVNLQIWTYSEVAGELMYCGNGRFFKDIEQALNYAKTEGLKPAEEYMKGR